MAGQDATRRYGMSRLDAREPRPIVELFNFMSAVNRIPEGEQRRKRFEELVLKINEYRNKLSSELKEAADKLENLHKTCTKVDLVGTGIGAVSGAVVLGSLVAAPFTQGSSLSIARNAATTGVMGGAISLSASLVETMLNESWLSDLQEKLTVYNTTIDDLIIELRDLAPFSVHVNHAYDIRRVLNDLAKLSEPELLVFFTNIGSLIAEISNGNLPNEERIENMEVDETVKAIIRPATSYLIQLDPQTLSIITAQCQALINDIHSFSKKIKYFLPFLSRNENLQLFLQHATVMYSVRCIPPSSTVALIVPSLAATMMVIYDSIRVVKLWKSKGDTPTTRKLRSMAEELEQSLF